MIILRRRNSNIRSIILTAVAFVSFGILVPGESVAYELNYVGDMDTYEAVYEDTLVHLARTHDLGFVEMRAANPTLDPWIPGEGAEVILPKRHLLPDAPREGVVINLPEMRVYAYLNEDDAPYTYPIGIGREGLDTPTGKTSIVRKREKPIWYPTARMREEDPELPAAVPPGEENPLGTHALYLGWPTYAMHGTNRPFGIGRRVSSGCIRLYPEDIKAFYEQVPVDTPVNVINQPIKVAWIGSDLYLEAHPDLEQAIKMEEMGLVEQQKFTDEDMAYIIEKAGTYSERLNWPRIRNALRERKGYPVRIASYFSENDALETDTEDMGFYLEETSFLNSDEGVVLPRQKPERESLNHRDEEEIQAVVTIKPPIKPSFKDL
ncbi:MAG: L,D-transpeptidase family protein [Alphaproteobacteria bacterium]